MARSQLASALKRGSGRNGSKPLYTDELAAEICDRLAEGEPLDTICAASHMPTAAAVRQWVREGREPFASDYARARAIGYEKLADEVIGISDAPCMGADGYADNGLVQKQRLQVESRKWMLAKMLPKQFGDKVTQEITGEDGGALITRIELVPVAARPRATIEHDDGSVLPDKGRQRRKPSK